jgi:hypothetical protein
LAAIADRPRSTAVASGAPARRTAAAAAITAVIQASKPILRRRPKSPTMALSLTLSIASDLVERSAAGRPFVYRTRAREAGNRFPGSVEQDEHGRRPAAYAGGRSRQVADEQVDRQPISPMKSRVPT